VTPQTTAVPCKVTVAQFVSFLSCCENRIFAAIFTAAGVQFCLWGRCRLSNVQCPVLPISDPCRCTSPTYL